MTRQDDNESHQQVGRVTGEATARHQQQERMPWGRDKDSHTMVLLPLLKLEFVMGVDAPTSLFVLILWQE